MTTPTLLSNAEQSTSNIFAIYDGWIRNPQIDIFYKVITVAGVLVAAGAVPQLRRSVGWTAAALALLILLTGKVQNSGKPSGGASSPTNSGNSMPSPSVSPSAYFVPPGVSW